MAHRNSDNANGKGRVLSPATSNSTDASRLKKKKRDRKKNKSNNNNTKARKEEFKRTAKDSTIHEVVVTTEMGNLTRQYRFYINAL